MGDDAVGQHVGHLEDVGVDVNICASASLF
jgi:hypothetical protein